MRIQVLDLSKGEGEAETRFDAENGPRARWSGLRAKQRGAAQSLKRAGGRNERSSGQVSERRKA